MNADAKSPLIAFRGGYLSKDNTDCLKGISASIVVIHHLYLNGGLFHDTLIGELLQQFGIIAVTVFFFCSGYGLTYSSNKEDYLNAFWRKRIIPYYSVCVLAILIYLIYYCVIDEIPAGATLSQSFLFGKTIVINGWYLQTQLVLYILFWVVFKIASGDNARILFTLVGVTLYAIVCNRVDLNILWYDAVFAFPAGIAWALKKKEIDNKVMSSLFKSIILLFVGILLFGIAVLMIGRSELYSPTYNSGKILIGLSSLLCIVVFISRIPIQFKVTQFLGEVSLEIYILHGIFIDIFKDYAAGLYWGAVISCTLIGAIVFHQVVLKYQETIKRVLT